jgi:hypothetical protein
MPNHLKELERLKAMDIEHYYPAHPYLERIKTGGYDKTLIDANMSYVAKMLGGVFDDNYMSVTPEEYLVGPLAKGYVYWWEPYRVVHGINLERAYNYWVLGKTSSLEVPGTVFSP